MTSEPARVDDTTTILHLCAGIDGAGLGLGITPTWVADTDPDAASVLAARHPDTPNLGDIRTVDWAPLADQVDILVAGYPCQPFSQAGQRKGTADPRHLWPAVRDAIAATRPRLVLLENVRGHLALGFVDVLGDLADLGMSVQWGLFSSAEIGAPHIRERLYVAAKWADPTDGRPVVESGQLFAAPLWHRDQAKRWRTFGGGELAPGSAVPPAGQIVDGDCFPTSPTDAARRSAIGPLLPTPAAMDSTGRTHYTGNGFLGLPAVARIIVDTLLLPTPVARDSSGRTHYSGGDLALPGVARVTAGHLLPTPTRADGGGGPARLTRSVGGLNLRDTARHLDTLLPTPTSGDEGGRSRYKRGHLALPGAARTVTPAVAPDTHDLCGSKWWPAVARWADLCGTPPPQFVHHGPRGGTTIDARFAEWMMGFPAGWATGIARSNSAALRLVGNSIQPQTAALAWSTLVARLRGVTETGVAA